MSIIRLQNNTPPVYTEESRDFQLLCRIYDCIINAVKLDIDSIPTIVDTSQCLSSILPLLQTKVGFFTENTLQDKELRYAIEAFPYIVKKKGSREGIIECLNLFLQVNNILKSSQVIITNESINKEDEYTIKILIESEVKDTSLLEELIKYIVPTGYLVSYIFTDTQKLDIQNYDNISAADIVIIDNNKNSSLRKNSVVYSENAAANRMINAIDTVEVVGSETTPEREQEVKINTISDGGSST